MEIGRKIYYEKSNGIVIWDKGEMSGDVVETTFAQDCEVMPIIGTLDPSQLGVLQLHFGTLSQEFSECQGFKVNPETEEIEFV